MLFRSEEGIEATIELINTCHKINPSLLFEVSTEEAIRRFETNEIEHLLSSLKNKLSDEVFRKIAYCVIQSGTSLSLDHNTGEYSSDRLSEMIKIVSSYEMLSKEHNGDYLDPNLVKDKFNKGLDCINIAPEFGRIETETYLEKLNDEQIETFYQLCYESKKWVKWVPKDFNPHDNKIQIIKISGHYIFSHPYFIEMVKDLNLNEEIKKIRITRAHLEEDAGKSIHDSSLGKSKIDLNRAGTPLLEIVSEPDMRSAAEASSYMKYVHLLVTYLGICDGNLQEGSLRCDANVSVKPRESKKLGTRTEIKNLNSFRFIEKAIEIEAQRQIEILESGGTITQETRLFDEEKQETRPMRSKEEANDYRYFPDPDLLPVIISEDLIKSIQQSMPELPNQKNKRYINEYQLDKNDAARIANDSDIATFFESSINHSKHASPKQLANWLLGKLSNMVNEKNINFSKLKLSPVDVSSIIDLYILGNLSQKQAGELLEYKHGSEASIKDLITEHNMSQVSDTQELGDLVDKILKENQVQFDEFKSGNGKVIGYLIGKVMQASKGKANPKLVKEIIESK